MPIHSEIIRCTCKQKRLWQYRRTGCFHVSYGCLIKTNIFWLKLRELVEIWKFWNQPPLGQHWWKAKVTQGGKDAGKTLGSEAKPGAWGRLFSRTMIDSSLSERKKMGGTEYRNCKKNRTDADGSLLPSIPHELWKPSTDGEMGTFGFLKKKCNLGQIQLENIGYFCRWREKWRKKNKCLIVK